MRMLNKNLVTILTLFMAVNGSLVFAKDKVVYDRKTKLDFGEASVDGQFLTPDGAAVKGDKNLDFDSLLQPRKNFNKEMKKNARAVR